MLIKYLCLIAVFFSVITFPVSIHAASELEVEVSHNDEFFIIDGEKYEAKTYCFNVEEGDYVVFIEGNPGVCTSAEFINLRTRDICEVWCE
jgi:hypothetical protein